MADPLGVIADDFTGACDVAVQFRKRGLETVILARTDLLENIQESFDVIVVDTETRNLTPKEAYEKVRNVVKAFTKNRTKLVYKKIDSTLRGNVGAEIQAIIDEAGINGVIVSPAFPKQQRIVIDGRLLINGVPIEKTEYSRDSPASTCGSLVAAVIEKQLKMKVGEIHLSHVRKGVDSLIGTIQKQIDMGRKVIVADAELDSDLKMISEASASLGLLPCGSAGLAGAVASHFTAPSRIIVVSGSVNKVSLKQIETAVKELDVKIIEPSLSGILKSQERVDEEVRMLVEEAEKALAEGKDVIFRLASSEEIILKIRREGRKLGMGKMQVADLILSILSRATKTVLDRHKISGLVLVGGDTAIRVMKELGVEAVRSDSELLPGVPISRIIGGTLSGMRIVTKAGGFGNPYTLVKIIKSLKENS